MKSKILLWFLIIHSVFPIFGQYSKGPINSYCFPLIPLNEKIPVNLIENGARAFEINSLTEFQYISTYCSLFLKQNPKTVFYFLITAQRQYLFNDISDQRLNTQFYISQSLPYPTEKELIKMGKHFVLISEKTNVQFLKSVNQCYNGYSDFVILSNSNSTKLKKSLFAFWTQNAHPVNFVLCPARSFGVVQKELLGLNNTPRISGRFTWKGEPVSGVCFNGSINYFRNTQFSIPFDIKIKLHLEKKGFELAPQLISAYYSSDYYYSVITVNPVPINSKMISRIATFEKDSLPGCENGTIIYNGVKRVEKGREKILSFDGKSYLSFATHQLSDSLLNLSIAFKMQITSNNRFQTIISQGSIFDIKIFDNYFCFTLTDKKAYILKRFKVEKDKWYDICVTISNGRFVSLYSGIQLVDTCSILKTNVSAEDFMIGNNIYQEHFTGDLKNIIIWNRTLSATEVQELLQLEEHRTVLKWYWLLFGTVLLVLLMRLFYVRKKKKITSSVPVPKPQPQSLSINHTVPSVSNTDCKMSLFGNFSLINSDNVQLAWEMFPKVKQMFLIIVINYINNNPTTTKELNDMLWPGMNKLSAKNNRGVTVQNLRQILSKATGLKINYKDKSWIIEGLDNFYIDYKRCLQLIELIRTDMATVLDVSEFTAIVSNPFLKDIEHEFIDQYKAKVNENILLLLFQLAGFSNYADDSAMLLKISNALFVIDDLNEDALQIRLRAYQLDKNFTMARISLESFSKKYESVYGEPYIIK